MKKSSYLLTAVVLVLALSATPVFARGPWPNGEVNPAAKTVTLEYGKSLFNRPVVKGFPTDGYADVWYGSTYERVSTADAANALLTAPQTANQSVHVSVPYRDVDAKGKLLVRHGLKIDSVTRELPPARRERLRPSGTPHTVVVSAQKHFFWFWRPTQSVNVTTGEGGSFSATLANDSRNGAEKVSVRVAGDAENEAKSVFANRAVPTTASTGLVTILTTGVRRGTSNSALRPASTTDERDTRRPAGRVRTVTSSAGEDEFADVRFTGDRSARPASRHQIFGWRTRLAYGISMLALLALTWVIEKIPPSGVTWAAADNGVCSRRPEAISL